MAYSPRNPNGNTTKANSQPVTLASDDTILSGIPNIPSTSGGLTTYHLVSAASTNATVIKNSAGQVYGWYIKNNNASTAKKVSFHNTTSTPTAGASIFFSIDLPAGSAANVFSDIGIPFSSGIAITTTVGGGADSDSTAVSANDLNINIFYK